MVTRMLPQRHVPERQLVKSDVGWEFGSPVKEFFGGWAADIVGF